MRSRNTSTRLFVFCYTTNSCSHHSNPTAFFSISDFLSVACPSSTSTLHPEPDRHSLTLFPQRSLAYSIHPYPCIGQWRFLDLGISSAPQYAHVHSLLKHQSATLLDLGCCFGQDVRKLIFDGAPAANLVASDLRSSFWDLGYDLFRDRDRLASRFVVGDVLEEGSLRELDGTIDIIHASSFFHLFSWAEQVRAGVRCIALLRRKPGALVFGRQTASQWPGNIPRRAAEGKYIWRHDGHSWQRLWDEIGRETGTRWRTEC